MKAHNVIKNLTPAIFIFLLFFSFCPNSTNEDISFNGEILPIFQAQCIRCHFDAASSGNLDLTSYESLMSGNSLHPEFLVVPGYPYQSLLYESVSTDDQSVLSSRMPQGGPYLQEIDIQRIEDWIFQGAKDN